MEEKILFENETIITDNSFRTMMLYVKLHHETKLLLLKLSMCLFIIYGSIIADLNIIDEIVFMLFAMLGIFDTLKIKESKHINKVKYEFFENHFLVYNAEIGMEVSYELIEKIKSKKDYYFFIVAKTPMIIGKNSFKGVTNQELKKFIKRKTSISI